MMDKRKKRRTEATTAFDVVLPLPLQERLVDDYWHMVNRESMAVPLPRVPSIHDILSSVCRERGLPEDDEVFAALRAYFDKNVDPLLLYASERPQHRALIESRPSSMPCQASALYGADHLLRLLVKLPLIASDAKLGPNEEIAPVVRERLAQVVAFLASHVLDVFPRDMESPSQM
eukprot:m51a1_g138 hypothetical protein (175) ;mRNA; r:450240-450962